MAKAPASDLIMPADKMRPMLAASKKEPVHAAMALSAEGEALLLLDRKASPRKVMAMLRASADKAKLKLAGPSLRYGRAEVDAELEPGVVRLFVNKDAPDALRMKLNEVVKRIAYQKVEFTVDPSLEAEAEGEKVQPADAPAASGEPPPPPAPDLGALKQRLGAAIGAIATETDPARKATLLQLAGAANAAIHAQDAAVATRLVAELQAAIGAGVSKGPGDAAATAPDKLLALFRDAKEDVDTGLNKLQQALRATGDDDLVRIADFGIYGMTEGTGVGLMKALMELRGATPASREALLATVRNAATAFRTAIFADGAVDLVDNNPFGVVVGIRAKLGPALDVIAKAA